jgi:hypothetical protein
MVAAMDRARPVLHEMTYDEYAAIPAVRASDLKAIGKSPKRYLWEREHRRETAAMRMGRAVHTAILEPHRYAAEYVVYDGRRDARTKDYQAFLAAHPCATVLSADEDREARETAEAVHAHPEAHALLTGGVAERVLLFEDPETGLPIKARLDYLRIRPGAVADVKKTKSINVRRFRSQAWELGYAVQLAIYRAAAEHATGHRLPVYIVACEAEDEHDVGVYECPEDWLQLGADEARKRLDLLADCQRSGLWPGQCPGIQTMEAPRWAEWEAEGRGTE